MVTPTSSSKLLFGSTIVKNHAYTVLGSRFRSKIRSTGSLSPYATLGEKIPIGSTTTSIEMATNN